VLGEFAASVARIESQLGTRIEELLIKEERKMRDRTRAFCEKEAI
jgi:hypothetical protein